MRRLLPLLTLLMPLAAAGQSLDGDTHALAQRLLHQTPDHVADLGYGVGVPLWRGNDGHMLMLKADAQSSTASQRVDAPLSFHVVDAGTVVSTDLQYGLDPHLQIHAGVSEHNWISRGPRVVGSEIGATYNLGRYSVGLSVGTDSTPDQRLPRVLPGATPGVNGLPDFDSSAQLSARGRVAVGGQSGIDLGASVGRIRLLPGNVLGINTLDQKALSFGVDHGPLSGTLVGRTMQPALPGGYYGDKRWSSIDLGVTLHLPWQGELSIGAQNLWSSGASVPTPAGPEPDQSRTPYVQYHQDL
ncbi:hypothetical protein [Frateuria sp. STR12]|uniref:hypothetical protein n=1 Tax=Frateuria hangzhouensis TaxID=2995589 RepID=UPI002260A1E6|nr:hypothetical protein [Frateuria sp. STR12]MCX7512911.1 hypothetical protein [Frateuria sp. STR12]